MSRKVLTLKMSVLAAVRDVAVAIGYKQCMMPIRQP
jgi:hypothetical protein